MGVLSNLEPKDVFHYFEEICNIPHGSFHTKQISDYCVAFAKEKGLTYYQDEANNIIMIKEASTGYEEAPPVIIQGHLDMVCEKEADSPIDFLKDGLDLQIDGDLIYAKGTTLGGDDGAAVAFGLALLAAKDIPHPKLEVVLTTEEEVGMLGAEAIDLSMLEGRILINLDSEEEGIFLTSCAGGLRANIKLPVLRKTVSGTEYEISIEGMTGGHSGTEIHKGHGNSNKLMGRLLYMTGQKTDLEIVSMAGGSKDNAIPRKTTAKVIVNPEETDIFETAIKTVEEELKKEQRSGDPSLKIVLKKEENKTASVLDRSSKTRVLMVLLMIPDGVQAMSMELEGLVETSLNLGVMELTEENLMMSSAIRSSVGSAKEFLTEKVKALVEYAGGSVEIVGDYPAWEFQPKSYIRDVFTKCYEKMYGKKPLIQAIHAGLECGLLSNKLPGLDCISLGPDMTGVHTTEETLSISSTKRTWELLCKVLEELK
ncbi:MAG: aminoacyl-histidine dipeptidase [Lachnospiraceae bacterium]|nr:aminoacyl-histidine dipeptidase [Lachnospiraceae bacterium]